MTSSTIEPHLPDSMGIWSEDGEVWLAKEHYPKRSQAIMFAMKHFGCGFIEVRCRSRWMRYDPQEYPESVEPLVFITEDFWVECDKDHPAAFPVWRCE